MTPNQLDELTCEGYLLLPEPSLIMETLALKAGPDHDSICWSTLIYVHLHVPATACSSRVPQWPIGRNHYHPLDLERELHYR